MHHCNLGATSPEEYGDYYAWGETETKTYYAWNTYKFYKSEIVTESDGFETEYTGYTKYVIQSHADKNGFKGFYDDKTNLDPEDDVAHVKLGGKWRMPTDSEFKELIANCVCEWVTYKGIKGRKFTSKIPGYTDRWIFLPAAGRQREGLYYVGSHGYYWSSSLYTYGKNTGCDLTFYSSDFYRSDNYRDRGQSIRPVWE